MAKKFVTTRRSFLGAAAALPLWASTTPAQVQGARGGAAGAPAGPQLPLRTTGLEHFGMVVPDVEKAGRFYGSIFNPELHEYITPVPPQMRLGYPR